MLKYQKAKVKLLEYEIPEEKWPSFPLNYRDLTYYTVLIISQYAEAINENTENKTAFEELRLCSEYYDAVLQSREQIFHDVDFALTGAAAYFFMDNLGSAKVLWQEVKSEEIVDLNKKHLYDVFSLAFEGVEHKNIDNTILQAIELFWKNANNEIFNSSIEEYRENIFKTDSPQELFWGEITCAVAKKIGEASARILLPMYSALDNNEWNLYFDRKKAINLLWPSQRLIGTTKILQGENAILQLPTGVGKTKSVELIIWSMFLSGRGNKALIVAPLRSLCNEITYDMKSSFPEEVSINQFSEVLEDDFIDILLGTAEKQILVCTPEKLQYIFHHDNSYLDALDLLIFDESHMFDDRHRGALYELLLTDIKLRLSKKQQLILMSAVLPNADQIVEWLFSKDGVLAYDSNITSTPKSIGFADGKNQLHYYLSAKEEEDFFVPYTLKREKIEKKKKERKERFFPEDSRDKALYYANILCKKGGVAIYFPQKKSIPIFFSRIKDLNERDYVLDGINNSSDNDELSRFYELYKEYYGKKYVYTETIKYGILPHYSTLPNGIKISTEYAFKKNKVKVVACTSTLAQGVNIPIKYLLITGTKNTATQMTVRNFQNLIGRTGRSGVYTGGDIIVTESDLYDNRGVGRGYYLWEDTRKLFNPTAMEACGSSILNIVRNHDVTYKYTLLGSAIINYICENYSEDWSQKILEDILKDSDELADDTSIKQGIYNHISNCKEVLDLIENEIIYLVTKKPLKVTEEGIRGISKSLLENSFAYYLATEEERKLLEKLFDVIESRVKIRISSIQKYSKIMIPMNEADRILEWIEKNSINDIKKTPIEILLLVEDLFGELYPTLALKKGIALSWIRGDSFDQMSKDYEIKVPDVEKSCQYNVSYQMSFLVGNIVDLVEENCINEDALMLLQQALRYGVKTKTAVSICEKVFNDRILAQKITTIIRNKEISTDNIIAAIKAKKVEIISFLNKYPSYFKNTIEKL